MSKILDELNKGKRVELLLETLTGEARQDFIIELADLFCSFPDVFDNQETSSAATYSEAASIYFKSVKGYLDARYPAAPTPTPAAAPVKEFDPFNL